MGDRKFRLGLVVGTFHTKETAIMRKAAEERAAELGLEIVARADVPGSYEAPLAVKRQIVRDDIDAVVVLGIIERGETGHGRVMGEAVGAALVKMQLDFMKPIGIGIIGPEAEPHHFPPRLVPHAKAAVSAAAVMLGLIPA
mgnify:FL=1